MTHIEIRQEAESKYPEPIETNANYSGRIYLCNLQREAYIAGRTASIEQAASEAFEAGEAHGYDLARSSDWGEETTTPNKSEYLRKLRENATN
jgi:hypothetical protein